MIPPHPLTNIEIQKYYQNEPRFNEIYSRDNLSNYIKDEACVINLDGYADLTHWIVLYVLKVHANYIIANDCFNTCNKH